MGVSRDERDGGEATPRTGRSASERAVGDEPVGDLAGAPTPGPHDAGSGHGGEHGDEHGTEQQFRAMVDALPTLAWTARADGYIDWYNRRWYDYTGTTPEELEGWGWQRVHDPAVLPEVLERWQASIATGQSFEMTFPLRGADGRFRPFLTCVTPLHDADGAVVRWVGINTDVGAERAARDAAERAAERAARLQALTAALAGARTEADVARVVVAEAVTVTGAATGAVTRRVAHSAAVPATEAEIVQEAGLPPDVATTWRRFPLDAPGPAAECIRTGTPIWLESRAALDARFPALHREWDRIAAAALATVPLVVGGEVVGAMTYTFREPRPIPAEDRAFFLALAGQASQALERARLFAAERAAREAAEAAGARVAFLAEASARLAGSLDVETTLRAVADLAVPALADWCFIELVEPDGRVRPAAIAHADPAQVALGYEVLRRYPIDPEAPFGTGHVLRTGQPELAPEIPAEALAMVAHDDEHLAILRRIGFRSSLSVPLTAPTDGPADAAPHEAASTAGRPFGVLSLVTAESGRRYGPEDLALAEEVARRAGAALASARLYGAQQVALRRATALQRVAGALAGALTPVEVAEVVVHHGREAVGASAGSLALRTADGTSFEMLATEGYAQEVARTYARFPVHRGRPLSDAVLDDRAVYFRSREESDARYPDVGSILRTTGFDAFAVLPVHIGGGVGAGLSFSFAEAQAFEADARTFLETLAALAGQAFERARLYAAERAARAEADVARERLTQVFEQAPVAVAVTRGHVAADMRFELANPSYVEIVPGRPQVVGRTVREVFPDVGDTVFGVLQRVLDTGEPFAATEFLVPLDRDGDGAAEAYYFNLVYYPLLEADDRVSGLVTVATEVTAQVRARQDAERSQHTAEVARLEAEEANRAKSQFLANMSHELRTPLNAIQGHLQLLELELHGPVTPAQHDAFGRIDRAQRHLLGLINDILSYARLESGRVEYDVQPVRVAEVIQGVLPMVEPQLMAKGLLLDVRLPEDGDPTPFLVWADGEKLAQVLLNLLSNAVKFTPAGGRVTVALADREDGSAPADRAFLRVADTGVGIPRDKLDAVFEPFVQVRNPYAPGPSGTGLGLAISRDLARGMGGELRARSTEGMGSTFTVALRRVVTADGDATDRRTGEERRLDEERRSGEERREEPGPA